MSTTLPRTLLRLRYEKAAEAYLKSLPLEHFMEATAQATQRTITLESLDLVRADRRGFQLFNELLVQYPHGRGDKVRQVVPDNMVVIHDEPIRASGSYDIPLQPVKPFWVLEYVSKYSQRKDYQESFQKYERDLKIDYYLTFYPDNQEMTLHHHNGKRYVTVKPNAQGRCPIPELEIEMAILDGWVRFWYRGELLPLPADLQRELTLTRAKLKQAEEHVEIERRHKERLLAQLRKLGVEPED